MSLINFLNPKFKPTVECDAVSADDHSAQNLIADNTEQLSRGFMAYPIVRPPVEMVFRFPKAVDLKFIKLWHKSGKFYSTAFEIYGPRGEDNWERVAYVRGIGKDVDFVTFCYQSDYSPRVNARHCAGNQNIEKVFFFRGAHKVLSTATGIKLVIKSAENYLPVLRMIEVWGLPARILGKADRELIRTIWNEITRPVDEQKTKLPNTRSPSRHNVPELQAQSELKIPEEFLDAITWELMIFPTILPSGKIVDQSTIDKHSEEEARWGRLPSDPFTGLEYTAQRRAILNISLKARIENFLTENSEHFKTLPRSLGSFRVRRSQNRHASEFANLLDLNPNNRGGTYSSLSSLYKQRKTKYTHSAPRDLLSFQTSGRKRMRISSTITAADEAQVECQKTIADQKPQTTQHSFYCANFANDAVRDKCIRCASSDFAYVIQTCQHLVCRMCLEDLSLKQMCVCKTKFCSANVERYHRL